MNDGDPSGRSGSRIARRRPGRASERTEGAAPAGSAAAMRLPQAKAFVVQLGEPADVPRARVLGRVEHVATGRAVRFGSRRELFAFFQQCCSAPPRTGRGAPTRRRPLSPTT